MGSVEILVLCNHMLIRLCVCGAGGRELDEHIRGEVNALKTELIQREKEREVAEKASNRRLK